MQANSKAMDYLHKGCKPSRQKNGKDTPKKKRNAPIPEFAPLINQATQSLQSLMGNLTFPNTKKCCINCVLPSCPLLLIKAEAATLLGFSLSVNLLCEFVVRCDLVVFLDSRLPGWLSEQSWAELSLGKPPPKEQSYNTCTWEISRLLEQNFGRGSLSLQTWHTSTAPSQIPSLWAGRSACGTKTATQEENSSHCCGEEGLGVDSSCGGVKSVWRYIFVAG